MQVFDIDDLAIELSGIAIKNSHQLAAARSWIAAQQRFLNTGVPSVILNDTFFNVWGANVVAAFANLPAAARAIPLIAQILAFQDSEYTPEVSAYVKRQVNRAPRTQYCISGTKALKEMLHDVPGFLIPLLSSTDIKYSVQEFRNICDTADVKMLVAKPGQVFFMWNNRGTSYPTIERTLLIGGRNVVVRADIHALITLCRMLVKVLTPPHVVNGNEANWIRG